MWGWSEGPLPHVLQHNGFLRNRKLGICCPRLAARLRRLCTAAARSSVLGETSVASQHNAIPVGVNPEMSKSRRRRSVGYMLRPFRSHCLAHLGSAGEGQRVVTEFFDLHSAAGWRATAPGGNWEGQTQSEVRLAWLLATAWWPPWPLLPSPR